MASNLRDRVQNNAVARRDPAASSIQAEVRNMEHQFALAMPKGVEAAQLVRDALTSITRNPDLAKCDRLTVLGGLMTCAQLGLRPGVLGHAWLLPFWNSRNRQMEAQLIIGYQGYAELANRSGQIQSMIARTVYSNDHFSIDYGLHDDLVHRPAMGEDRGIPVGYYAIVKTTSGGHAFEYMSQIEMEKHRDRYAMAKKKDGTIVGPWATQFEQMAQKTVFLKLKRWMPKATDLQAAIEADNSVRVDITPDADPVNVSQPLNADQVDYETGEVVTEEPPTDAGDLWAQEDAEKASADG